MIPSSFRKLGRIPASLLAGGVKQPGHRFLVAQSIVQLDCAFGRQRMRLHAALGQQSKSFLAYVKSAQHALRQHDRSSAMLEQLGDIGRLNAGLVSRPGLLPIPFPRSARKYLGVPESADAFDVNPAPSRELSRAAIAARFARRRCPCSWHPHGSRDMGLRPRRPPSADQCGHGATASSTSPASACDECARSSIERIPTGARWRLTTANRRTPFSVITRAASLQSWSSKQKAIVLLMTSRANVVSGSLPAPTTRQQMSRSVTRPISAPSCGSGSCRHPTDPS